MDTKVIDLGWCIGKISGSRQLPRLTICSPSEFSEDSGLYTPAESISIHSKAGIQKLADFLNEYLKEK